MKKNIEKSAAPTRRPTTLAPVRVRMRKIENGTSGLVARSSIATKAAISANETGIKPSVWVEAPAGLGRGDQGVDEDREGSGDGDRAGDVEGAGLRLGAAFGGQAGGEGEGDQGDRDVAPEHPLPTEAVGEDAPEQDARRAAGTGDGSPDPERLVAL